MVIDIISVKSKYHIFTSIIIKHLIIIRRHGNFLLDGINNFLSSWTLSVKCFISSLYHTTIYCFLSWWILKSKFAMALVNFSFTESTCIIDTFNAFLYIFASQLFAIFHILNVHCISIIIGAYFEVYQPLIFSSA